MNQHWPTKFGLCSVKMQLYRSPDGKKKHRGWPHKTTSENWRLDKFSQICVLRTYVCDALPNKVVLPEVFFFNGHCMLTFFVFRRTRLCIRRAVEMKFYNTRFKSGGSHKIRGKTLPHLTTDQWKKELSFVGYHGYHPFQVPCYVFSGAFGKLLKHLWSSFHWIPCNASIVRIGISTEEAALLFSVFDVDPCAKV